MSNSYFYQERKLATINVNGVCRSIFQYRETLLAEWGRMGGATLLAVDTQRSVMRVLDRGAAGKSATYTAYGYNSARRIEDGLMGYAGERFDPALSGYWLGRGHRLYMPMHGRLNAPDKLSPFGRGGINAYAYCGGDPINRVDPSGQWFRWLRRLFNYSPDTRNTEGAGVQNETSIRNDMRTQTEDTPLNALIEQEYIDFVIPGASPRGVDSLIKDYPQHNKLILERSSHNAHRYLLNRVAGNNVNKVGFSTRDQLSVDFILKHYQDSGAKLFGQDLAETSNSLGLDNRARIGPLAEAIRKRTSR